MEALSPLIIDLALILVLAGSFSVLFKWLKQPVVLAYIVAGIVMTFFIVKESPQYEHIETWADIGIIFLLFGLGLEFSFKKLMQVGPTAFVSTIFIVISMIGLGYMTGLSFGWSHMTSLFLGAMICMSSTMIILKVFEELNLTNKSFASIVLGILIIEDLVAVLLMVLLSTVAVSKNVGVGQDLLFSLFKLLAFLLFWFLLGTYLLPTFLRKMKRFLNDETLLIVSIGMCLGMVYLATQAGFSDALGAFIMGSILAETLDAERIEKLILPIKNFFGAIFFVSVGMMVSLPALGVNIVPILVISVVVIFGQMLFATGGVLLSGQNLKTAVSAGFSLTQIGEFSFIIGNLGLGLGVIEGALYQTIVGASIVTIFVTPYVMKSADPAYVVLARKLPKKWLNWLNRNSSGATGAPVMNEENLWKRFLKSMITSVVMYYFICIVIVYFSFALGIPLLQKYLSAMQADIVGAVVTILLISPFLLVIVINKDHSKEFLQLWEHNKANRGPLIFTIVVRILMCVVLIMYILHRLFEVGLLLGFSVGMVLVILFMTSRRLKKSSQHLHERFHENFNEKEKYEESQALIPKGFVKHVLQRDMHLSDFLIQPHYSIVGQSLKQLKFRQYFGVNVVTIMRNGIRINIPNGDERIYPNDHLIVLGTDKQMEQFQARIEDKQAKYADHEQHYYPAVQIRQIELETDSALIGQTALTSRMQDDHDCLLVGVEREGWSIMNPGLDLVFEAGDILWLVGEKEKIKQLHALKTITN
ncbi:MAG: cation:proton antiporter [Candidatus Symbiothrix sp.]|jgi:CPA2 family monovalent cation:H+ antiporter-2|nr:cation:proton antiporter [Candidatus Symbiothrix sp.]